MESVYFDKARVGYEAIPGSYILTDNNLTVEINRTSNIRTNIGITKGKIYWEVQSISNAGEGYCGVLGERGEYYFRFYKNGQYRLNYAQVISYLDHAIYGKNDIVGIALDVEMRRVGIYINGDFKGTVDLITQEHVFYPTIGNSDSSDSIGSKATANFGETPFKYPIPAGYTSLVKRHQYLYLKDNTVYGMHPINS